MQPTGVPEYRVHSTPSRVEHWRHIIEIAAFIIAAVWAFYVFIYQERIKPASEPARVQFTSTLSHETLLHNKELVRISVVLKNAGSSDVALGALLVNAYGIRYASGARGELVTHPIKGAMIVNRAVLGSKPELLYSRLISWKPFGVDLEAKVAPGSDVLLDFAFVVERGKYDTIRQVYAFCYQRYDSNYVVAYKPKRAPDGGIDVEDLSKQKNLRAGMRCGNNYPTGFEYAL